MSFARAAGLGAVAVAIGVVVLWVAVVIFTIPSRYSGLDFTQAIILWISTGSIVAVVVLAHLVYARVLMRVARLA